MLFWWFVVCADTKLSFGVATAPVPPHPLAGPAYLAGPWSSDPHVYTGDQWPVAGFNHAYSGSSIYPVPAAYPTGQPKVDAGSGFPGSAPSGRSMKLKSEHLPVVGVC